MNKTELGILINKIKAEDIDIKDVLFLMFEALEERDRRINDLESDVDRLKVKACFYDDSWI